MSISSEPYEVDMTEDAVSATFSETPLYSVWEEVHTWESTTLRLIKRRVVEDDTGMILCIVTAIVRAVRAVNGVEKVIEAIEIAAVADLIIRDELGIGQCKAVFDIQVSLAVFG